MVDKLHGLLKGNLIRVIVLQFFNFRSDNFRPGSNQAATKRESPESELPVQVDTYPLRVALLRLGWL